MNSTRASVRLTPPRGEHERASAEFKRSKAEFDSCAKAFKSRLEKVKAEGSKRREDKKSIAAKAGVPHQYRNNVWVSTDSNGNTNIYFGGVGKPDGPGHGHYVMDRSGKVTYKRDPRDEHGAQNFTDDTGRGGTLYDRRARTGSTPRGVSTRDNETRNREGIFYDRRRDVDLHVTQYYDDNKRVSWDTDGKTDRDRHWTIKIHSMITKRNIVLPRTLAKTGGAKNSRALCVSWSFFMYYNGVIWKIRTIK